MPDFNYRFALFYKYTVFYVIISVTVHGFRTDTNPIYSRRLCSPAGSVLLKRQPIISDKEHLYETI